MRFIHSLTLSVLVIYLLLDNVLEAKQSGWYQWVRCKPNSKNANCIEKKGPKIDLLGQPKRLPARAVKDINDVDTSEESIEESGMGSGDFPLLDFSKFKQKEHENKVEELKKEFPNEEEGSALDSDYINSITPDFGKPKLSAEDLREDNMIE